MVLIKSIELGLNWVYMVFVVGAVLYVGHWTPTPRNVGVVVLIVVIRFWTVSDYYECVPYICIRLHAKKLVSASRTDFMLVDFLDIETINHF